MIPEAVLDWLRENQNGELVTTHPVGGGCINNGRIIKISTGESFFLKTNPGTPTDMFTREFEGLVVLGVDDGPRVPVPYLSGQDFLLMEDLTPGTRRKEYWDEFGQQLAALHNHTNRQFGFDHDNYIGSTQQPNPWTDDGWEFFAEHRLLFQAMLANRRGLISPAHIHRIERLSSSLKNLVPYQPASLSHGDLWSGNATVDAHGNPAIIDPAAHYGWAEAELAMTTLFGSFPQRFYKAYEEIRPLAPGYESRFPIYNLYHLLNHVNLFGTGYLGQVSAILDRFSI
jgi:fructosamine-3-kinase